VASGSSAAQQPPLKGTTVVQEPTRTQRAVARRSAETRATIPDLELGSDVDVERSLTLAQQRGCSFTAVLVRACAQALREHPRANAAYRDGRYELYSRVNVGVTVQTEDAFVTPTVLDADTKSLEQLSAELGALTARAQSGELTPPQLAGATFTLTDLSHLGVARVSSLLTPPQAASVTCGAVRSVPMLRNGTLQPGQAASLTLACDARILFWARATGFLASVTELLERGPS
jgi:pyruvate dehydrogenase E2 component (dihydrolipoamide acetyltransferase)